MAKQAEEKKTYTFVCAWCGKEFTVDDRRKRKFCSEECRKAYLSDYNTNYITQRRKTDEEYREKSRIASLKSTLKGYAKGKWEGHLDHADVILKLSQMKDGKILIAKYLDQNFVNRASGYKTRTFSNEEEERAASVLESLGDEYLTSN